ncbi:MAG: PH domain-containing protein [Propionibacteriales bacterium]|nr:PH domain-containing protein [Propionibacteriales bacterium]
MPPVSAPDDVALPHTWRPFGARIAGGILGGLLLLLVVFVWFALSDDVRSRFSLFQRTTLIGLGLLGFLAFYAIMRSRVSAAETGVTVVNGYRRRVFEWSQVVGVNLRRGAPWAGMDLSDGTSISMLAIQGSDGQRAIRAVRQLRRLVDEHSRTDRDD